MLIYKNSFKKIKKSLGRFISLILIVALGSAFFSGIREASSDMIKTMDKYYDDTLLMDYKIVSTMGLTDDDVLSIEELSRDLIVVPTYSFDILVDGNVTRIHAIEEEVNKVNLITGRMPNSKNECLVEDGKYAIGDKIKLEDNDYTNNNEFTVVGTITSSLYTYKNKGISSVGDGKLDTYIYIPKDNFDMEYYTEIYLRDKNSINYVAYEEQYLDNINKLENKLKDLKPIRETIRYEEILKEATDKINEAEDKLIKEKNDNGKKLEDAKKELDDNKKLIEDSKVKWLQGKNELEQTKESTESELTSAKEKLNQGKEEYNNALNNYGLKEEELDSKLEEINNNITNIENILSSLEPGTPEYIKYNAMLEELNKNKSNLELLINTKKELENSERLLTEKEELWNSEYNKALKELESNYQKISDSEEHLDEGYKEYQENYEKYISEIEKAEKEIEDARKELDEIEKPNWYLLSREDNSGYTNFYESATKIDSIAAVFPIFFMLVVFLMSLNTMTRMIEEERSEIGLYVSLGISKIKIFSSYLFYVLIATSLGLIIGLSIGYAYVPHILYNVYKANFIIPKLITYAEVIPCVSIIVITLILMISVTLITINKNFKYMPATLLRPEAPKNGKKVLLERVKIVWNRLSFTWKVTIRNLFRYKKRIIMTILGISGCTALLLTGFGIRDSVSSLIDIQYNKIHIYDSMLILKDEQSTTNEDINNLLESKGISNLLYTHMENYTFSADDKKIDTYVLAFKDTSLLDTYIKINDLDGKKLELSDNGVIITEKMAELLNAKVGNTIQIRNSDNELFILKVEGICENYVNSYIYMNANYYTKAFGDITYNTIITNVGDNDYDKLSEELINSNYFSSIQYTKDNIIILEDIIDGMNNIVYLIIVSSSLLAIIVLYNLTTININERTREIATLKVLGFHDNEVSTYVYRETIILTIIGIGLGLFLGVTLNLFVLTIAETEELLFIKDIHLLSYIITFIIMIVFTIVVEIMTYFILKKIDMIESLKSVE